MLIRSPSTPATHGATAAPAYRPMNATTDAMVTAQTGLGWRHVGWPLLFCSCCAYFDRLSGPLRIVEKPAQQVRHGSLKHVCVCRARFFAD
jgi:hypothetical protein